jgi:hypothetical protein
VNPSVPSWFSPIEDTHPVPVARSLDEMAEAVFRSQDLQTHTRQDAEADKQRQRSQAQKLADLSDEAEMRAFMGQSTPSAIEYYLMASDAADRAEEADRKRRDAQLLRDREKRIAQLEAQLVEERATAHTRAEHLSREWGKAVEGWGHARAERDSFRNAAYRSYYR